MHTTDKLKTGFFQKEIKISFSKFFLACMIYLVLPIVIFFIGYLKIWWAILFSVLTVGSAAWAYLDIAKKKPGTALAEEEKSVTIKASYFLWLIPFALFFLYLGGVGEFGWAIGDHRVRYATLNDLINYKWPVIYDFSTQQNPVVAETLLGTVTGIFYNISQESKQTENYLEKLEFPD